MGEWIELSMANPIMAADPDFEFTSDADVAIFTRLAADAVGATKMDRPEWAGVNPQAPARSTSPSPTTATAP